MQWVTFIIITGFYYGSCEDCVLTTPKVDRPEIQLHEDLRSDYDILEQPKSNNTKGVEVKLDYLIEDFVLSPDEETLTIYTKNTFKWDDDRLKWEADKYKGLQITNMYSFEIWSPMLKLKNRAAPDDSGFSFNDWIGRCEVRNTGSVACMSTEVHPVMCSTNMKNWPYDRKNCMFKFDDATTYQHDANIIFSDVDLIFFMQAKIGNGWQIITGNAKNYLTGDHQLSVELYLERKAECLEASIVIPSFIVSVLTVTSIFLHVNNEVRLGILWLNLLNHFAIISEISENIPKYGFDIPAILLFVSWSTIWTMLIALLTFLLRYISKSTTPPPSFLVFINSSVLNSSGKHLVIPRWNVEMLDKTVLDSLNHCTEWMDFSNIVNTFSLFVTLISYIVLFSIFMPHGTPYTLET